MNNRTNVKDSAKAEVLTGLYNPAKVQGIGFFAQAGKSMTVEEAGKQVANLKSNGMQLYFDDLHNKVMKADLSSHALNADNVSIKIFTLYQPLKTLGRESEFVDAKLRKLDVYPDVDGKITQFPSLNPGEKLVCAYNQWGVDGMANMYECHSVENMQELYDGYSKGGALTIDWYGMADKQLENTTQIQNNERFVLQRR